MKYSNDQLRKATTFSVLDRILNLVLKSMKWFLLSSVVIGNVSIAADEEVSPWISVKRITLETAMVIAQEAIKTCRTEGVQISVTVVDRAGAPQVMLRDVLAPTISTTISEQKARAALSFNLKTSGMKGRFTEHGSVAKVDGLIFSAGGVPINAGGRILGGVGVSGAPSGILDEKCAQAGIDAVVDDLEMAE